MIGGIYGQRDNDSLPQGDTPDVLARGQLRLRMPPEKALVDARLVPLAPPPVPVSEVAAAEDGSEPPSFAADDVGLAASQSGPVWAGELPYVTPPSDTYTQFFQGYRAAGGQDEERIDAMIWCESSWRIDPGGYHLGLGQFDPGTWATVSAITGYTDWRDPYSQGVNVSVWASMVSPGTTAGWPSCFWAIDW